MANSVIGQGVRTHTLPAGNRAEYPREHGGHGRLREQESNKAVEAALYVRHGQLIAFDKGNPDVKQAGELLEAFAAKLRDWQDDYQQTIASAIDTDKSQLTFEDDAPRLGWEENAYVLDYPRLRIRTEGGVLETRLCVAVCTGVSSSKVWTRVSMPADVQARVGIGQIKELCPKFHAIADKSVAWGFAKLKGLLEAHLPNISFQEKALVRATSLGILDGYLAAPFERLYEESVPVTELLKDDKELDYKLTDYCRKISSIVETEQLSDYAESEQGRAVLWFKMPMPAVLPSREVVQRMVLYLMRETSSHVEIIGLAYDDSEKGDIVFRSGAALSSTIGPWI